MAKPSWVEVPASGGSGKGPFVINTTDQHTGRVARTGTPVFTSPGVEDVVRQIVQAGKPEFVALQATATANKEGGNVTITGKSNSSKLTFTLGTGSLGIVLPANYIANSATTGNGVPIAGDPGALKEYDFSIVFSVPKNETVDDLARQVIVTNNGGQTATCALTQAAGEAYLNVTPETLEIAWDATSATFEVDSNTTYTVIWQ